MLLQYFHEQVIHSSENYSGTTSFDSVTIAGNREMIDRQSISILAASEHTSLAQGREITDSINGMDGDAYLELIGLVTASDRKSEKLRELKSEVAGSKLVLALLRDLAPTVSWVPISLKRLVKITGNIGLGKKANTLMNLPKTRRKQMKTGF